MRVLISLTRMALGRTLGGQVYIEGLLRGLNAANHVGTIGVCCAPATCSWLERIAGNLEPVVVRPPATSPGRILFEHQTINRLAQKWGADAVLFPFNLMPWMDRPSVLTVPDLVDHFYCEALPRHKVVRTRILKRLVPAAIRRADHIVVWTRAIADELVKRRYCSPADITVVPLAVDPEPLTVCPSSSQSRRILILQTGCYGPHKCPELGIRALAELRSSEPDVYEQVQLVITGVNDTNRQPLESIARENGVAANVSVLNRVPREEFRTMVGDARVLLFASIYEGFGLGVVEGLMRAKVVLASDIPVFREVSGGVAEFFRPGDATDLAVRLKRLINDEAYRSRLQVSGPTVAQRWTWRDHATLLAEVVGSVRKRPWRSA